jgi:hypothetical protein
VTALQEEKDGISKWTIEQRDCCRNARVLADHREGETRVEVLDALEIGNLFVREADREGVDVAVEVLDLPTADKREDVCSRNAARRSAGGRASRRSSTGCDETYKAPCS